MGTADSVPAGMGLDGAHLDLHTHLEESALILWLGSKLQPLNGRAKLSPYTGQGGIEV